MNAFVASTAPLCRGRTAVQRGAACVRSPVAATPFFGSHAFGTPVSTRVQTSPSKAPMRMEVTITVGDNEPIESAIRRFKKDVTKSGHLFELRRRRYFETNTEKRLRKAASARRKARMARNMKDNQRPVGARAPTSPRPLADGPAEQLSAPAEEIGMLSL